MKIQKHLMNFLKSSRFSFTNLMTVKEINNQLRALIMRY